MSVTHLAGDAVLINRRGIQRCLICGEKLIDTKGMMGMTSPDGRPSTISPWAAGSYVRQDGCVQVTLPERFPETLPDDLCIVLVEEP